MQRTTSPRARLAARASALLLPALVAAAPATAQALTPAAIDCRAKLGRIARDAVDDVMRARSTCTRDKLRGKLGPAVDCGGDPVSLGGSGTGDAATDKRLERHLALREDAAVSLPRLCDSDDPMLDVDPSDILSPSSACGSLATWAEVAGCVADLGRAQADTVQALLELEPPSPPVSGHQVNCFALLARQSRRAIVESVLWRAKCYEADDVLNMSSGLFACDSNITPPGSFESTGYLRADKRLQVPVERLYKSMRSPCDVDLAAMGVDTLMPDHSGGGFVDRVTLDDVFDSLDDRVAQAIYTVTKELFPVSGYCGDGSVDGDEQCDDGNNVSNDGCDRDCTLPACGNGSIDGGNPLDLPGEECDDGNNAAEDGCSPDCKVEACGNGHINPGWGEICDDGGESPSCDDNCTPAACGDNTLNMSAGEECDLGAGNDSNAPDTCGDGSGPSLRGPCQLPFCQDAVVDTGEQCDDGAESIPCDTNCTIATCGDGDLNATRGETCDDGNASDSDSCPSSDPAGNLGLSGHCITATCGDGFLCTDGASCTTGPSGGPEICDDAGASASCDVDCSPAVCGDGLLNGLNVTPPARPSGEACDDGNLVDGDGCDGNCTATACGNGITTSGEFCDDGNLTNGDGCDDAPSGNCTPSGCGNGIVAGGEACDGDGVGHGGETASCDSDCSAVSCGDGELNATAGEICDGGGDTASCDSNCTPAVCGDGTVNAAAGETCDTAGETAACDSDCTAVTCGDGKVNAHAGEQCDTAGASASCDADCSFAICGDGTVNGAAGETCDDAGESAACDSDCTAPSCGDGVVNATAGEQCDDGNGTGGDGCSASCQVE